MSEVQLVIYDRERGIGGHLHGGEVERVVAALAAEPETIGELEAALTRFVGPERSPLRGMGRECRLEPWDAGLVVIDLAARLIAHENSYTSFALDGEVLYRGPMGDDLGLPWPGDATLDDAPPDDNESQAGDDEVWIPYRLPQDWLFVSPLDGWESLAARRRKEREATPPLDARRVLYGELAKFVAGECLAAAADETAATIHARWLSTPRDDLRGAPPREVLLALKNFIDMDLQWRAYQWSFTGFCPPGLSPDAPAYEFGGFGTHEIVLYYELVRHLLEIGLEKRLKGDVENLAAEIERNQREWLYESQIDMSGMSPHLVIGYERARLPVTMGHHHVLDDDCEICRMMAELPGPTFWHLDGCNMDDEFVFSFHATQEDWDAERREWEESAKKWRDAGPMEFDDTDPFADD